MALVVLDHADAQRRLAHAIEGLERRSPELSARRLLTTAQVRALAAIGATLAVAMLIRPLMTVTILIFIATVIYLCTVTYRIWLFGLSAQGPSVLTIGDAEARAIPDERLPVYTVLVAAYKEPEVIAALIRNLNAMEYPPDRLDIKLLLEADDSETIETALRVPGAERIDIVLVPPAEPRTKPKALNYGLTLARGKYVTIFDAEDQPDPLQLRRAVGAFDMCGSDVACIQAKLVFGNAEQNLITRWFTTEYVLWFSLFLPGLVAAHAPLPLGGTSNHFRREVLDSLGGWDPFNVTEDADLGVRLHRQGWRARVLESITVEEANSDFVNWVKQRSRWYKGYLQTWLIHLRHPRRLYEQLGWKGFLQFNLFVGGTPLLALLNPLFWNLTILWFVGHPVFIQEVFPAPVYYLALVCWALGNFAIAYLAVLAAKLTKRPSLVLAACLTPLYWVMMSIGATKAFIQLVFAPSFWEKTVHGLGHSPAPGPAPTVGAQASARVHAEFS